MNSYELSRFFWDFAFENPSKIKPIHCAIYFFSIEHCNRLGWKKEFGLPTSMVIEAIGIKSYSVYKNAFDDLVEYNFFDVRQYSKNQYSSNIIALKDNTKANTKATAKANAKALDKALQKHSQKQSKSIDSIDKQETIEQETNKQDVEIFNFSKSFLNLGVNDIVLKDWIKVRKSKKLTNSETAFKAIKKEIDKSRLTANECILKAVEKSWGGFEYEWIKNKNNLQNANTKRDLSEINHSTATKLEDM